MRRCMAAVLLVLSWKAVAQENWQKAKMSDAQLTTEQIAVYRAVLREYLKGSERTLNLANVTEPIDSSDKTCFKGMDARDIKESASVIHRIESLVAADSNIVLVDPGRQQTPIKEKDPQNLIETPFTTVRRSLMSSWNRLSKAHLTADCLDCPKSFSTKDTAARWWLTVLSVANSAEAATS